MARVKPFVVEVTVSGEFMRSDRSMAMALAHDILRDKSSSDLIGPRGGRYVPITEVRDIRGGQTSDDFMFDRWSFVGRLDARYVRPAAASGAVQSDDSRTDRE